VNVKTHTVSTARETSAVLGQPPQPTPQEAERWSALEAELGGLEHSLLDGPSAAVPHNAQMLRLERDLAELMFRRPDGAQVIVATPTLAQGLNLPAHIAILASDMRADLEDGGREALAAHEILNAAALIPEAVLTFADAEPIDAEIIRKLQSVLLRTIAALN
jgi:replicative superfamily II helicase